MQFYFDFSAVLGLATLASALLWGIDCIFLKRKRMEKNQAIITQAGLVLDPKTDPEIIDAELETKGHLALKAAKMPKWADYAKSFFPVLLVVFVLRAFIVEPYRIPSGSMRPTLLEGDFILVNKYAYGLRLPLTGTRLIDFKKEPKRGDILVFRAPRDTSVNYIKRVIGLPGDKVRYDNKKLYINGKEVPADFIETSFDTDGLGILRKVQRYEEHLDTMAHPVYLTDLDRPDFPETEVPKGHYFVMGDNRDHSADSREWGFVPESLILGRAFYIWLSIDMQKKDIRWGRLGGIENNDVHKKD